MCGDNDDLASLSELKENSKTKVYLSAYLFAAMVLNGLFTKKEMMEKIENLANLRDWKSSALYIHSLRYMEAI